MRRYATSWESSTNLTNQIKTYWAETKAMASTKRSPEQLPPVLTQGTTQPAKTPAKTDARYEEAYKEAFESFQRGQYDEAVAKFTAFTETYSGTPLRPMPSTGSANVT